MTSSFPFGQYEEKNIIDNVAIYVLGYRIFKNYVIFLIKILKVTSLKTNPYFIILILKKLHKRCLISSCIN